MTLILIAAGLLLLFVCLVFAFLLASACALKARDEIGEENPIITHDPRTPAEPIRNYHFVRRTVIIS